MNVIYCCLTLNASKLSPSIFPCISKGKKNTVGGGGQNSERDNQRTNSQSFCNYGLNNCRENNQNWAITILFLELIRISSRRITKRLYPSITGHYFDTKHSQNNSDQIKTQLVSISFYKSFKTIGNRWTKKSDEP